MSGEKWTPGLVSRLPRHNGDGYYWGGDVIVTFEGSSINLGPAPEAESLGHLIAASPALYKALKEALSDLDRFGRLSRSTEDAARAALSLATQGTEDGNV